MKGVGVDMKKLLIPFVLALMAIAGCEEQTTLFSSLEEAQANAIMAALLTDGITCTKTPGDEGTWNVMIGSSRFADAAKICEKQGLPRRQFTGIGESFKKTGMVSSPSEERIRFMDAISQDLAKTISMIDGVIDARVHVVLPQNDPFAKNTIPSSAAVAVRARWDADVSDAVPQIKSLVKNSIEGLSFEKITVTIFQDTPPKK